MKYKILKRTVYEIVEVCRLNDNETIYDYIDTYYVKKEAEEMLKIFNENED